MKIFISHSSNDINIAKELINIIRSSVNISAEEIRCTSGNGYRLPIGVNTNERLKREIFDCEILIGIITPSSMESHYVLFELGARWGINRPLFPFICSESGFELMSGPLNTINTLDGTVKEHVFQFVTDLATSLNLPTESPEVYSESIEKFCALCLENTEINSKKSNDLEAIESLLKKTTLNLCGHDQSLFDIFKVTSKLFGGGTRRDNLWLPLLELTSRANNGSTEIEYEDDYIIGELSTLDLIHEVRNTDETAPKYYLTRLGKEMVIKIKNDA